jgi:hypothetical protein
MLRLFLGGAALQRCDNCIVLNAASAAEVTLSGGWAILTGKYNAGLSFNIDRITGGAPLLALFEKWPAEQPTPFDSSLRGRRSDLHLNSPWHKYLNVGEACSAD